MRLLACFAKHRIVLDDSVHSQSVPASPSDPRHRSIQIPDPTVFIPTTVAELHPEYAHSEPYCFAAKTESARVIVEKARERRGISSHIAHLPELPELGKQIIVHGPSYNSKAKAKENVTKLNLDAKLAESQLQSDEVENFSALYQKPGMKENVSSRNPNSASVRLQVEMPTTVDEAYVDSDDQVQSENVDEMNVLLEREEHSINSKTDVSSMKKEKGRLKRSQKSLRSIKSRKSKQETGSKRELSRKRSDTHGTFPPARNSENDRKLSQAEMSRRMENTPKELLAPIRVPRLSNEFNVRSSPALSSDSWAPNNSSERYEDVEGDGSFSFLGLEQLDLVGKQTVIHKASQQDEIPTIDDGEAYYEASDFPAESVRSKRKSMPFAQQLDFISSDSMQEEETSTEDLLHKSAASHIPQPTPVEMPPQTSLTTPVPSAEEFMIGTPTTDEELFPLPSPATKLAALQRVQHDAPLDLPLANTNPFLNSTGMARRASSSKRKTVSFRDESPIIIEPNLTERVPSKSVPRNAILSRGGADRQELTSALKGGSPSKAAKQVPVVVPQRAREWSDSSSLASDDVVSGRLSRRSSRVSIKDREAVREASKRQSQAVAQAMAEQIRGIPKSAMLAYSENEVLYSEDDEELFGYNGELNLEPSIRRRARSTKSVRLPPVFEPGEVPAPPPPPPFAPQRSRVVSVRNPPPPPASPVES